MMPFQYFTMSFKMKINKKNVKKAFEINDRLLNWKSTSLGPYKIQKV